MPNTTRMKNKIYIGRLFEKVLAFTYQQYNIMKITDPCPGLREGLPQFLSAPHQNIYFQDSQCHSQSMQNCFYHINNLPIRHDRPRWQRQKPQQWLEHGKRIAQFNKGNCLDCIALVAAGVASCADDLNMPVSFEILKIPPVKYGCWLIVVNRKGPLDGYMGEWGVDCFCTEIWWQNQLEYGWAPGTFWAIDANNRTRKFFAEEYLTVEATFNYSDGVCWEGRDLRM